MAYTCNPRTFMGEARELLQVWDQPELHHSRLVSSTEWDLVAKTSKNYGLFPHSLNLSWSCDLLWSVNPQHQSWTICQLHAVNALELGIWNSCVWERRSSPRFLPLGTQQSLRSSPLTNEADCCCCYSMTRLPTRKPPGQVTGLWALVFYRGSYSRSLDGICKFGYYFKNSKSE